MNGPAGIERTVPKEKLHVTCTLATRRPRRGVGGVGRGGPGHCELERNRDRRRPFKFAKCIPVSSYYNKIYQAAHWQPPPVKRRQLLTNAVNHVNHTDSPKPPPKAPSSPALPKVTPPSPAKIITDKSGKLQFHRVGFLGEVCGSVIQIGNCF